MVEQIIIAIVSVTLGWILHDIFPKIGRKIKLTAHIIRQKLKMEKNAVILFPFPILKSPKGYLFNVEGKKKLYCEKCYSSKDSKFIQLVKTGRFSRKYVCPVCNTEYKK